MDPRIGGAFKTHDLCCFIGRGLLFAAALSSGESDRHQGRVAAQGSVGGEYTDVAGVWFDSGFNRNCHVFTGRKLGLRISVLAVLVSIVWALSTVPNADFNGCLKCHRSHHETLDICIGCHRGNPRTERVNIAHYRFIQGRYAHFNLPQSPVVKDGRRLIEKLACRRCHGFDGRGNQLAASLDRAARTVQPLDLAAFIKKPVPFMPNFYFTATHIDQLVNAILAAAADPADQTDEIPSVIHFKNNIENRSHIFDRHCGACHRILTRRWGGLGQGDIGPNLSGLLTRFYPQNDKGKTAWNPSGLKKWLQNPRDIRVNTQMIPVELNANEFSNILALFYDKL